MAYSKAILAGSRLEWWHYERSPPQRINVSKRVRGEYRKNSRRRADNARRARENFRRLVAANLGRDGNPALLTLTVYRGLSTATAFLYLRELFRTLRDIGYRDLRYISVVEFQKRGSIHFHVLVWGLPYEIVCTHKRGHAHAVCLNRGKCERSTRNIQRLWMAGYCDLHTTDGSPKLASYMAKYLFKEMLREGEDTTSKNTKRSYKAYSASRNIMRPVQVAAGAVYYLLDQVGVDKSPVQQKEYDTQWLGRANYKRYQM